MLRAKDFKEMLENNPAVREFMAEIDSWISQLQIELEDADDRYQEKHYHQFRGSLRALRRVQTAPTVMYETKLLEEQEQLRGQEDA